MVYGLHGGKLLNSRSVGKPETIRMAWIALPPAELAAAILLQRQGTIVTMEACKLFSRRRVATTACAVLPAPGIVG